MAVKVRFNKNSVTMSQQLARQISGSPVKTQQLIRKFKRGQQLKVLTARINATVSGMLEVVLHVFRGGETDILGQVSEVAGVPLSRPWRPLDEDYVARKRTDSFWLETGATLAFVEAELAALKQDLQPELYAQKLRRGDTYVTLKLRYDFPKVAEPLRTLLLQEFTQRNFVAGTRFNVDNEALVLAVNHAFRGFLGDVAEHYRDQLTSFLNEV